MRTGLTQTVNTSQNSVFLNIIVIGFSKEGVFLENYSFSSDQMLFSCSLIISMKSYLQVRRSMAEIKDVFVADSSWIN